MMKKKISRRQVRSPSPLAWLKTCVGAFALTVVFQIQPEKALATEALDRQIRLDIPAGTALDDALIEWGRTAGMSVMLDAKVAAHHFVRRIRGDLSARSALELLLKDSGLTYVLNKEMIYIVVLDAAAGSDDKYLRVATLGTSESDLTPSLSDSSESAPSEDLSSVQEGNDHRKLEQVVVTAQKRTESLQEVPITISVLNGNELDTSSFVSTKEALATVPGLADLTNGGGTQLSLRGVTASNPQFSGQTPIAFYLDGVPISFIRSAIVPDTNVYDLQRIEVLSGPQGTLYGASALNGVIRILTTDADLNEFDFKGRTALSSTDHGSANNDGEMAANIPLIEGKLAVRLVASSEHESGWIDDGLSNQDGPIGNHINDVELGNERIKLSGQPTDTLSFTLSGWHSSFQAGSQPESDPNYNFPDYYPIPMSNDFNVYSARVNNNFPGFSLTSTTGYLTYTNYSENNTDTPLPGGGAFAIQSWLRNKGYTEELNLSSTVDGPWKWSAGAFYRNAVDHTYQNLGFPVPLTFFDSFTDTSKSEAIFGELARSFFDDQLELSAGARYFRDDQQSYPNVSASSIASLIGSSIGSQTATSSATTPRAIVTWKPSRDFTAYFSYGQGFRAGIPQDYLVAGPYPAAKPDKLTNYEFGIKGDAFHQHLSFTLSTYYIHWSGVQQQISVPIPGTNSDYLAVVTNAQSASGPGADFSVTARPIKGLDLNATFSWNDLTFDHNVYSGGALLFAAGNRLDVSPKYTASASISYTFPLGASGVQGQFLASENYTSILDSIYILNEGASGNVATNLPSNSMLIARAQFAIMPTDHWTVALFADNLANYNGSLVSGYPSIFDTRTIPRTVGVRVDYHLR